jgi:ABC-type tungstate transport system substrate-binding protein
MEEWNLLDKIHAALMSGQIGGPTRTITVANETEANLGPIAASLLARRLDLKLVDIKFVVQPRTDT